MAVKPRAPSLLKTSSQSLSTNGNGHRHQPISDIQRTRMLGAMAEVCVERGAANIAVAHVVERAGVSRRTFYEIFEDGEDCLLATIDDALQRIGQRVLPAYHLDDRWRDRIRTALEALLRFFEQEPRTARLLVVEMPGAGRRALELRTHVLARLSAAIDRGRQEARAQATTDLTAEGVVGATLAVIQRRLLEDERAFLMDLLNPLMSMIVLPYMGPAVARRELERPPVQPLASPGPPACNPLKELHIRLTYRTVRVLESIASHPGSSNREIADGAGIADQGQISKLLARLHKLGLVENSGTGGARGEPNAWALTPRGQEVHRALAAQDAA